MSGRLWLVCVIFTGMVVSATTAQEDLTARLTRAVALAEEDLAAERDRITQELAAQQEALNQALAKQKQLTHDYVDRKLALAQKQAQLQQQKDTHQSLRGQLNEYQQSHAHLGHLCRQGLSQLKTHLVSLPPSEGREFQRTVLSAGEEALAQGQLPEALDAQLNLTQAILQESRTCAQFETSITDPQGQAQSVRLLRIGQILTAYSFPNADRVGLAYQAPQGQTGFRWSESLPVSVRELLQRAFLMETTLGVVSLPLDVTQCMHVPVATEQAPLLRRLRTGGLVMIPLGLVALLLLVLTLERSLFLGREGCGTAAWCRHVLLACQAGDANRVTELAQKRRGMMGRILQVCLNHRTHSGPDLDDALQEAFLYEFPRLERGLPSIRTLASLAPMLGLLGTVTGIIATFDMISVMGGGKPRLMAGGISEALVTTATGLIIAIPGLLAYSVLGARVQRLISNAESFSATLTNLFKQQNQTPTISERTVPGDAP